MVMVSEPVTGNRPPHSRRRDEIERGWEKLGVKPRVMTGAQEIAYGQLVAALRSKNAAVVEQHLAESADSLCMCELGTLAVAEVMHLSRVLRLQLRFGAAARLRDACAQRFTPTMVQRGRAYRQRVLSRRAIIALTIIAL